MKTKVISEKERHSGKRMRNPYRKVDGSSQRMEQLGMKLEDEPVAV